MDIAVFYSSFISIEVLAADRWTDNGAQKKTEDNLIVSRHANFKSDW